MGDCCDPHWPEQIVRQARRKKSREVMSQSVVVHIATHSLFATRVFLFLHTQEFHNQNRLFFSFWNDQHAFKCIFKAVSVWKRPFVT